LDAALDASASSSKPNRNWRTADLSIDSKKFAIDGEDICCVSAELGGPSDALR
jgi:hypothetical protein